MYDGYVKFKSNTVIYYVKANLVGRMLEEYILAKREYILMQSAELVIDTESNEIIKCRQGIEKIVELKIAPFLTITLED